jgi:hypothetical protein
MIQITGEKRIMSVLDDKDHREIGICAAYVYECIVGDRGVNTLLLNPVIDIVGDQFDAPVDLSQSKEPPAPAE